MGETNKAARTRKGRVRPVLLGLAATVALDPALRRCRDLPEPLSPSGSPPGQISVATAVPAFAP